MIVVTGTAPRCGTSAMMRELLKEYKPHSYSEKFPSYAAPEKNPEGFWDIKKEALFTDDPIPTEEDSVIKLWHPQFSRINSDDVNLVIVMTRKNFYDQVQSIRSCAIAEGQIEPSPKQISQIFKNQQQGLSSSFSETTQLRVNMETLKKDPESVISYIKEIL
tara:strand:+ start:156 stop:641 length:486 start_codon:yes stop_codon:yes gene_type:complete